ncbi:hypothetical protein BaRGS_00021532, partial [Batillaria attramentaria]
MTSLQTLFILIHIGLCDVRADFSLDPEAFKLTEVIQKANETKKEAEITVKYLGGMSSLRRIFSSEEDRSSFSAKMHQKQQWLSYINYTEGEDVDINVTTTYPNYRITNWVTGFLRKEVEGSGTTFSDTYYWELSHDALERVSQTSTSRHFKLKTTGGPQGLIVLECGANAPTRNAFVKRLMIGTYLTHYPSANTSFFSGFIGFLDTGKSWQNVECTENSDCWINCLAVGNEPTNITLSRQDQNGIWVNVPRQIVNRRIGVIITARVRTTEA